MESPPTAAQIRGTKYLTPVFAAHLAVAFYYLQYLISRDCWEGRSGFLHLGDCSSPLTDGKEAGRSQEGRVGRAPRLQKRRNLFPAGTCYRETIERGNPPWSQFAWLVWGLSAGLQPSIRWLSLTPINHPVVAAEAPPKLTKVLKPAHSNCLLLTSQFSRTRITTGCFLTVQ